MEKVHVFSPLTLDESFDICVVGGGLAGVMAAISAAREGMKVILVEKYGFLGGMATCGLVNPFMRYRENGGRKLANGGLFTALQVRMYELGGTKTPDSGNYMEEFMKLALDRMLTESGVRVLFHAKMSEVRCDNGVVKSVTCATVSGNIEIRAKFFIDATGNGDLCAFAGMEYYLGREEDGLCQPMTLNFRLANVDWNRIDIDYMQRLYKQFRAEGKIKNPREDIMIFRMPEDNLAHFNTTRIINRNPVDIFDLSRSETDVREQVYEMYLFLKNNIPGMEESALVATAPEIGVRESRRIIGKYEITTDDIVNTVKFDDSIARGTYGVDIHNPAGTGTVRVFIRENDYYTIPYRSLIPIEGGNVLVAGRPISADHGAHSALRIMPITTCIGEGAGCAAAYAVKNDCAAEDVMIQSVRDRLTEHGALV